MTVVELLPVHQFDPQEGNYWGYMTLNFFAPHQGYAVRDAAAEFREMVGAFHAAGIEVWLDVVYNHTCEGDQTGPTYSWRGIDNSSYYLVGADGHYWNDTGCGNTLRCAHDGTRVLILESLRHWVNLGVDGFRFDLASVLARDVHGQTQTDEAALISEITALAALLDLRVVAEAWDIGVNLLGRSYPGRLWAQWNGQYRDDVRAFVRGDAGKVGALMQRLYGSDDLFPDGPGDVCRPYQSVNFITAHDGFCLYDLVAYNQKHNEANGHGNADGTSDNRSWNCGWEGDDGAPAEVLALRHRQVKNFFTLLMLANGTPMFCAGDEFLNTQRGNNNPYNQDNETTWLDWSLLEKHRDIFRFFQRMIAFRKSRRSIARGRYWREDVRWHGADGPVDFGPESRCLAYCLIGERFGEGDLYVMINAFWQPVLFRVQEGNAGDWKRFIDTSRPSPDDIVEPGSEEILDSLNYQLAPRSDRRAGARTNKCNMNKSDASDDQQDEQATQPQPAADVQTRFAWLRTRMALQTTLAAWVRTATSLIGFGFAIVQFLEHFGPLESGGDPKSSASRARDRVGLDQRRQPYDRHRDVGVSHRGEIPGEVMTFEASPVFRPSAQRASRRGCLDGGSRVPDRCPGVRLDPDHDRIALARPPFFPT